MSTTNEVDKANAATIGTMEKAFRAVIGFASLLAILLGLATTPLQYFLLSCVGIYLIHTAICGMDPFYSLVHRMKSANLGRFFTHPTAPAGTGT